MTTMIPASEVKSGFARRLRLLRKTLGFKSARAFAEYTGISRETLHKYEQGENMPVPANPEFQLLKGMTGVTTDWLLYGDADTLPTALRVELTKHERRGTIPGELP